MRSDIIDKVANYGRVGYRMVTHMMRNEGRRINHKQVERIWREQGPKLAQQQPRKRRLFLNDGSCVRLRPEHKNDVWSYDFAEDRTMDRRKFRFLHLIDEYTRECLAWIPRRSWKGTDVMETLADIMLQKGSPEYIRSDNGPEFIVKRLREWLSNLSVVTTYIELGSPWENGYCKSFNNSIRDGFLNRELFGDLYEAQVLANRWKNYYNGIRPYSGLGAKLPPISPKKTWRWPFEPLKFSHSTWTTFWGTPHTGSSWLMLS